MQQQAIVFLDPCDQQIHSVFGSS